jgi:3-hydroxybutyryl-CoA dehydrogenase
VTAPPENVAVVGGGAMGSGIAHVLAAAGHRVELFEPDPEVRAALPERLAAVRGQLDLLCELPGSVSVHESLAAAVGGARFVVEAGPESLAVKREIFADLEAKAPAEAILATNTSALPIAEISAQMKSPERVLGTHFWNPPHLVSLVEVVESEATAEEVVARTMALLAAAGMRPVHVKADIPGFIGNRLQHALKREAIALVAAGHCSAEDLDEVVKHGFGARLAVLGPLEQSDLGGLELTLAIHETLMPDLDRTARAHPYLVEKVRAGETGAAAGRGFREWDGGEAQALRERVTNFLLRQREESTKQSDTGSLQPARLAEADVRE